MPRIVIMAAMDSQGKVFSVDTVNNTVLTSNEYDLRYILAMMNCRFNSWFAYKFIYCSAIRTMHFDNYYVGKIPIVKLSKNKQQPFIDFVDKILTAKKKDHNADTSALEKQIDEMVYALYNLTPEEIAVVEGRK